MYNINILDFANGDDTNEERYLPSNPCQMCSYLDLKSIKIKGVKKNKKGNQNQRRTHLNQGHILDNTQKLGGINTERKWEKKMYKNQF